MQDFVQVTKTKTLTHYGVKGMRWGQHLPHVLAQLREGIRGKPKKKWVSSDYAASRKIRRKKVDQLSTKELREYVERKNWEKKYKELKASDITKAQKAVNKLLSSAGSATLNEFVEAHLGGRSLDKSKIIDQTIRNLFKENDKKKK